MIKEQHKEKQPVIMIKNNTKKGAYNYDKRTTQRKAAHNYDKITTQRKAAHNYDKEQHKERQPIIMIK